MTDQADLTPLMRQYRDIKRAYQDAILFFRVGDFYEMFYEDAEEASRLLSIALTSRDKSRPDPVPLCGVPYHAATAYIAKLLQAGRTVALCDQVEDPKSAKGQGQGQGQGLFRREVVRLYTPGTLTDSELLAPTETSVVAALAPPGSPRRGERGPVLGLAALDLSTGEFSASEFAGDGARGELLDELARLGAKELLYPEDLVDHLRDELTQLKDLRLCAQASARFERATTESLLRAQLGVASLAAFGCEDLTAGLQAAGAVLAYLRETQRSTRLDHVRRLHVRRQGQEMHLDSVSIRNLELVAPLMDSSSGSERRAHTLLDVLDRTVTVLGNRRLRDWIVRPLAQLGPIQERLDSVQELTEQVQVRATMRGALRRVQDVVRLSTRVSLGTATPRDLLALKVSLAVLPELGPVVQSLCAPVFCRLADTWDDLADVYVLAEHGLLPDAPASIRDGGIIKEGYDGRLDELRKARREGKSRMATLEVEERAKSGIDSLKIRFNQVFGYYIEVTKANLARVPDRYIRRQTLANAERFTTAELKELEDLVLGAEEKLSRLEQQLFEELRAQVALQTPRLQVMGDALATLDALTSLAEVAALNQYVKPLVHEEGTIRMTEGRHPVVEQLHRPDEAGFIPNDTLLNLDDDRLLIITGPNMAGKSTYLRQVALITLMAHVGSFVPARSATIGLVDRIFTRVGASDNLAQGQSTFMVEMTETAKILNCATPRSLILLDEIGRGTSTYDGLSIAWAVAEFIHDRRHLGARTLFATHYHEMTQLAARRHGIKNYCVSVRERDGHVLFLRKIVEGGADRSYGIYVATLAGLPSSLVERAQEVLAQLEKASSATPSEQADLFAAPQPTTSDSFPAPHPIIEEVRQMDLFSMTPLDALNRLADLKRRLELEAAPGEENADA